MSLFSSIAKTLGKVASTAGGIALGGAGTALKVAASSIGGAVRVAGPSVLPAGMVTLVPTTGPGQSSTQIQLPSIGPSGFSLGGFSSTTGPSSQSTAITRRADTCPLTKAGKPRRTKKNGECFKTPSMNVLNGKALRRSMRRIEGFKRAANIASRITIRKECRS